MRPQSSISGADVFVSLLESRTRGGDEHRSRMACASVAFEDNAKESWRQSARGQDSSGNIFVARKIAWAVSMSTASKPSAKASNGSLTGLTGWPQGSAERWRAPLAPPKGEDAIRAADIPRAPGLGSPHGEAIGLRPGGTPGHAEACAHPSASTGDSFRHRISPWFRGASGGGKLLKEGQKVEVRPQTEISHSVGQPAGRISLATRLDGRLLQKVSRTRMGDYRQRGRSRRHHSPGKWVSGRPAGGLWRWGHNDQESSGIVHGKQARTALSCHPFRFYERHCARRTYGRRVGTTARPGNPQARLQAANRGG